VARSEGPERRCQGCRTRLARDNHARLCSPCSRHEVQASSAPTKQDGFWERAALRDALESRHFGQVLNAYRYDHRPVLTQAKVGRWLGLTQGQVSRLERTAQPTHDLNKLDQWARALHIPQRYLWFQLSEQPACADPRPRDAHSLDDEFETGGEDVQRRQLLRAAAAGAASVGSSTFGWFSTQSASRSDMRAVGMTDMQIVREMTQTFRRLDNRFGGGHAHSTVTNYLAYRSGASRQGQRQASRGSRAGLGVGSHGSAWTRPDERRARLLSCPSRVRRGLRGCGGSRSAAVACVLRRCLLGGEVRALLP
jgi:transcriptional regulator with XRE-family HTH domain